MRILSRQLTAEASRSQAEAASRENGGTTGRRGRMASARAVFDLQRTVHAPDLIEAEEVLGGILAQGLSVTVSVGDACVAYALAHRFDGPPAPAAVEAAAVDGAEQQDPPQQLRVPQLGAPVCASGNGVFLHDLCVHPALRGLGVSRTLVGTLLQRHPRVHLVSLPESVPFWRHLGAAELPVPAGALPSYPDGSVFFVIQRVEEATAGPKR